MASGNLSNIAVWALTPNGRKLAETISRKMPVDSDVYLSLNIGGNRDGRFGFQKLGEAIQREFMQYSGHIFVMSTGIVVRLIAPLIVHKTEDPAVVVVDDSGHHAISLLSGHLGGANQLARETAAAIGARPVITTATDVNQVPAIDMLAKEKGLSIENPEAIKIVNMALLMGNKVMVCDPYHFLADALPTAVRLEPDDFVAHCSKTTEAEDFEDAAYVLVTDHTFNLPTAVLVLRPASLFAGIGCNRNTEAAEILSHLAQVLGDNHLSPTSLSGIASIDVKADEAGLIAAAATLKLPLTFYDKRKLNQVTTIQNPSEIVEKHVGVKSVCEAAAILASGSGNLIVPKGSTKNVTVAIARINYLSSESDRAARNT